MKATNLIKVLRVGFLLLYRGSIWLGGLFLFIMSPLWQEINWQRELSHYKLSTNGSRIIYDTTNARWLGILKIRPQSSAFPYSITKWDNAYNIDSLGRVITSIPKAELTKAPDSLRQLIQSAEIVARRRQAAEIDSVLRANPESYVIKHQNDYVLLEPSSFTSFQLKMNSGTMIHPKPLPAADFSNWSSTSKTWEHVLQYNPSIRVKRESDFAPKDFLLVFGYRTWHQFKAVPIIAMLLGQGTFILSWIAMIMGSYQFKRLFDDLSESNYFSATQFVRMQWVGWVMIGYFIARFLLDNAQNLYVRHYLQQRDFYVSDFFTPFFPENWSILIAGLTLLVFARLFRYGHQLQEDAELTI